jgi:predicted small secreted protein
MEFKKMAKKIILCIILIILGLSLTGCQTIEGIGGDIKWTGQKGAEILGGKKVENEERY